MARTSTFAALLSGLTAGACGGDGTTEPPGTNGADASCQVANPNAGWTFTRLGVGTKPALAVDGTGTVHFASLTEDLDGAVSYGQLPSGATAPSESEVVARGYFYGPLDIAVEDAGSRAVVFHDHDLEDQVLARFEGGAWSLRPMSNSGHDGWYNVAAFDDTGRLHTATYDPRDFNGQGVNYGVWDGTGWSIELAAPGAFDYAGGLALALGTGDTAYVAYFDDIAGVSRIATRTAPSVWGSTEIEARGASLEVGRFPDMLLDPDGSTLHLVYLARTGVSTGTVRYAVGTPRSLTIRDLTDVSDFDIGFDGARDLATLALRPGGTPVVSVQTRSELAVFEVGAPTDSELARFQARDGIRFRQQTSTQVGPDGRIHVAFWQTGEETPGTLCHAVSS